ASPLALSGGDVDEVVVEAVLVGKLLPDEAQSLPHAFCDVVGIAVAACVTNAEAGQAKSCGGNAGQGMSVASVEKGAVLDLAAGAHLGPEEIKGGPLHLLQQIVVGAAIANPPGFHEAGMLFQRGQAR